MSDKVSDVKASIYRGAKDYLRSAIFRTTLKKGITMDNTPFFIIRGAPGAGKSTFSRVLQHKLPDGALVFETDNFFVDLIDKRTYHFNPKLLGVAHTWNQGEVIRACRDCPTIPVIVANTFCHNWEIEPYLEIAKMFKRPVFVFTLQTKHDNVHGVPDEKVEQMRLGLQNFDMDDFVRKGFSVMHHYDIHTDEDVTKMTQMVVSSISERLNIAF